MSSAVFILSAFGDEIADDPQEQFHLLRSLHVGYLDLRGAWGKNVLDMDDEDIAAIWGICADYGIAVSGIGSPVGKSPLANPIAREEANLVRMFEIAEAVGTRTIRVFSFYPPGTGGHANPDDHVEEAAARLVRLTELARRGGYTLLLENEKGIVGDTPERCQAILRRVNSPHLRFAWDPANFVQVGVERVTKRAWPLLGQYVANVHVKDAMLTDGSVRVAGDGDGQVPELLSALRDDGYRGFLALEPHLAVAGHSGGFSGVDGMTRAVNALRRLMESLGCREQVAGG